ncbi:MAG: hypothetical protein HS100_21880 [Anaerolineales bacterium]|nr:hypothetical protein [Anaerolineales bacterium]
MRTIQLILILTILLSGCTPASTSPTPVTITSTVIPTVASSSSAPTNTPFPPATSTPPLPILPHDTIDPSTLTGKLMMGYQGWFSCPGDGTNIYNGYYHWIHDGFPKLNAESYRVDMFPDTRELTDDEKCPTALKLPDGSPAYVYTSANDKTVLRHFQWMSEYGIDGVFLQRFGVQLAYPEWRDFHTDLLVNVRDASETYGRAWAVMYDVTGSNEKGNNVVTLLERDWKYLVDSQKILESPQYLHHNGLPVVAIWGLGFDDRPGTAAEAMELLDFFQNNPDPKYRAIVLGGVPIFWRTLQAPARRESAWKDFYCALDIISPWTVGVAASDAEVDNYYRNTVRADMVSAQECGAEYMPVVYPGTSYHNPVGRPFNEQPRRGGRLYWRQVYDALSLDATMIYNAMFDEVDESTAMYKIAETSADIPAGIEVITMDTDGESLPSDWYLRLAGEATKMLRGEIPLTDTIPITPSEPEALQQPEQIQLKITTSSDWTTIKLGGIQIKNALIASASAEATQAIADLNESLLVLTQSLDRANAGKSVEMIVDLFPAKLGDSPLTITIGRGSIGKTVVEVYIVNGSTSTLVQTIQWADVVSGENLATFEIPAALIVVKP